MKSFAKEETTHLFETLLAFVLEPDILAQQEMIPHFKKVCIEPSFTVSDIDAKEINFSSFHFALINVDNEGSLEVVWLIIKQTWQIPVIVFGLKEDKEMIL